MNRSRTRSNASLEFSLNQPRTSNEFAANVWQCIRNRQIAGVKFRREYPIPPYTVDFCCIEQKLIIEIEGEEHLTEEGLQLNSVKDRFLSELGFKLLRIPGYAVAREDGEVILKIREFVERTIAVQNPSPQALPPDAGHA